MTRLVASVLFVGCLLVSAEEPGPRQSPAATFRTGAQSVAASVSVLKGNRPVTGLVASDFILRDNGVEQTIESVGGDAVPVDLTLVLDTSGSVDGAMAGIRRDAAKIAAFLEPGDRLHVLTIDTLVEELLPLQPQPGVSPSVFSSVSSTGISSVHDAIAAALLQPNAPGRRRLIIAITDCIDTMSIVSGARLVEIAGGAEAVLHVIIPAAQRMSSAVGELSTRRWMPHADFSLKLMEETASRTGGELHRAGLFRGDPVNAVKALLESYRQSYVLHYSPTAAAPGWHAITVSVRGHANYKVTARRGYFVETKGATVQ